MGRKTKSIIAKSPKKAAMSSTHKPVQRGRCKARRINPDTSSKVMTLRGQKLVPIIERVGMSPRKKVKTKLTKSVIKDSINTGSMKLQCVEKSDLQSEGPNCDQLNAKESSLHPPDKVTSLDPTEQIIETGETSQTSLLGTDEADSGLNLTTPTFHFTNKDIDDLGSPTPSTQSQKERRRLARQKQLEDMKTNEQSDERRWRYLKRQSRLYNEENIDGAIVAPPVEKSDRHVQWVDDVEFHCYTPEPSSLPPLSPL